MMAALQNNFRVKVQAMAAQGMWDASEADGSTYLGGCAARRRQPVRMAPGDPATGAAGAAAPGVAGNSGTAPPPPPTRQSPGPPSQQPPTTAQQLQPPAAQQLQPPPAALTPAQPTPATPQSTGNDSDRTLLHLSPGKRGQLVRVSDSPLRPPPPGAAPAGDPSSQRQQIIVIQQEGEEEIDLSRVLGSTAPSDAQTLTMNADGVLVDDQGNPVSLMVEGGGTATHLLEYLRGSEPSSAVAAAAVAAATAAAAVRPPA